MRPPLIGNSSMTAASNAQMTSSQSVRSEIARRQKPARLAAKAGTCRETSDNRPSPPAQNHGKPPAQSTVSLFRAQRLNARQGLAFHPLQERAAGGRHIGHLIGDACRVE